MSLNSFLSHIKAFLAESGQIAWPLFRIMVPISIGVKILKELGVVEILGHALQPLMQALGLPGPMGLVWATAMVTNLYGGMVVFISLVHEYPLTVAQATVLTSMMLIAHSLPVELKIAQKAGARLLAMTVLRIGSAILYGFLLSHFLYITKLLLRPNILTWTTQVKEATWGQWALGEVRNLVMIFFIIVALVILMKVLDRIGVIALLTRALRPLASLVGIGCNAIPLTIVGLTMGLAYGGGLIIKEAAAQSISKKDIVFSLSFLSLCHGLIEDSLLMWALGGNLAGILAGRLLFTLALMYVLVKVTSRFSKEHFERYFFVSSRP